MATNDRKSADPASGGTMSKPTPPIRAQEIVDLLRSAINGQIGITLANPDQTWDGVYCGNVDFMFGNWRLTLYNDCFEMDYVAFAVAPDGRRANFDQWWAEINNDPIGLLTHTEIARLEALAEDAK